MMPTKVPVRRGRKDTRFVAMDARQWSMLGQLLPDDFDDDTRITEATLRYHPPRAWVDAAC